MIEMAKSFCYQQHYIRPCPVVNVHMCAFEQCSSFMFDLNIIYLVDKEVGRKILYEFEIGLVLTVNASATLTFYP